MMNKTGHAVIKVSNQVQVVHNQGLPPQLSPESLRQLCVNAGATQLRSRWHNLLNGISWSSSLRRNEMVTRDGTDTFSRAVEVVIACHEGKWKSKPYVVVLLDGGEFKMESCEEPAR